MVIKLTEFHSRRAFLRIIEAFISVLLILGVVLVIISKHNAVSGSGDELKVLQEHILNQVAQDGKLRGQVLSGEVSGVETIIQNSLPENYNYSVNICNLGEACGLASYPNVEVYSSELVISANLTSYDPKVLKLFFWKI